MKLAAFYCVNYLQDTISLLLINVNETVSPRTVHRQGEFLLAIYGIPVQSFFFFLISYKILSNSVGLPCQFPSILFNIIF